MSESSSTKQVNQSGIIPTAAEIAQTERQIGHKLPQAYIDLFSNTQAAFPFPNEFEFGNQRSGAIDCFYRFSQLVPQYHYMNGDYTPEDDSEVEYSNPRINGSYIISGMLPIIDTSHGNVMLAVDEKREDYGAVYFWDHDLDHEINEIVPVAKSLPEFMGMVKPYTYTPTPEEEANFEVIRVVRSTPEERAEIIRKIKQERAMK